MYGPTMVYRIVKYDNIFSHSQAVGILLITLHVITTNVTANSITSQSSRLLKPIINVENVKPHLICHLRTSILALLTSFIAVSFKAQYSFCKPC